MRKKISLFTCITAFITFTATAQQKSYVELKGTLVHFNNSVQVEDMSELQYLLPLTDKRLIIADSTGHFNIKFPLAAANYFRIGRNILYLTPGDKMEVYIDFNNPELARFSGTGSAANNFLRATPFPKAGSYLEGGSKVLATPQQTIDFIIAAGALKEKQLDTLQGVSEIFIKLELARVKADMIDGFVFGKYYPPSAIRKDSAQSAKYTNQFEALATPLKIQYSKNFVDHSLLKLVVYRDFADDFVKADSLSKNAQPLKDWIKAGDIIDQMKHTSDKELLKSLKRSIDSIKTPAYHKAVNQSLTRLLKFGKGDTPVDFTAADINGNAVKLSSLKGKVIYIDLWATWCGPCLKEMPSYEKLKTQYANDTNVVFISLSIDDNIGLWKANVASRNAGGNQWIIDRSKLNSYNIVGIPRTLLIGSNFIMEDLNAPLPSDKKLPAIIDSLKTKSLLEAM